MVLLNKMISDFFFAQVQCFSACFKGIRFLYFFDAELVIMLENRLINGSDFAKLKMM